MKFGFPKLRNKTKAAERRESKVHRLRCNICHKLFRAASAFHRFCRTCKEDDEIFRFSEWMTKGTVG